MVVTPKKALEITMYELNPMTAEATSDQFSGRSTFRDLHLANTNRPDFLNLDHYTALGVNLIDTVMDRWLFRHPDDGAGNQLTMIKRLP